MGQNRCCSRCGTHYDDDVLLCVECGIDLVTGLEFNPVVEVEEEEEDLETLDRRTRILRFVGMYFPGLFNVRVLIMSALGMAVGMGVMAFCVLLLQMGLIFEGTAVGAGGLIVFAQAFSWIQVSYIGLVQDILADFSHGAQWAVFLLSLPFAFVGGYILLITYLDIF